MHYLLKELSELKNNKRQKQFENRNTKAGILTPLDKDSFSTLKFASNAIDWYNESVKETKDSAEVFFTATTKQTEGIANYFNTLSGGTATMGGYIGSIVKATAKTIGLQLATTALNAAISIGLSVIISSVIQWVSEVIHYQEKLREVATENAKVFNNNTESVDSYVSKIKELKTALVENTLSESEAYQKRLELLEIQDSIVEMYGIEAKSIDLVTASADEATAAISKLNAVEASKNITASYKQYQDAEKEMVYRRDFRVADIFPAYNSQSSKEALQILKRFGIEYDFDDGVLYTLETPEKAVDNILKAKESLLDLRKQYESEGRDTGFLDIVLGDSIMPSALEKILNKAQGIIDKYGDTYNEYVDSLRTICTFT